MAQGYASRRYCLLVNGFPLRPSTKTDAPSARWLGAQPGDDSAMNCTRPSGRAVWFRSSPTGDPRPFPNAQWPVDWERLWKQPGWGRSPQPLVPTG